MVHDTNTLLQIHEPCDLLNLYCLTTRMMQRWVRIAKIWSKSRIKTKLDESRVKKMQIQITDLGQIFCDSMDYNSWIKHGLEFVIRNPILH